MASSTTIDDLPDDMLHEIFGHVIAAEQESQGLGYYATRRPSGAHRALRCVCRRWRDIADWVKLDTSMIYVDTSNLANAGAVRARHPTAFNHLTLTCSTPGHTTDVSRAAASLINGSADLRRALLFLELSTCCLPALVPAVTPVASCSALGRLYLIWQTHEKERVVPSNMLAPLSALRMLRKLVYRQEHGGQALPEHAVLAPLPALPDAPRLTCLCLQMTRNFVPVGSDAALGRLRRLEFEHLPQGELPDAEDPFRLRAAVDAGTWQPSRLTGLQELKLSAGVVREPRAALPPSAAGSRPGSEWAPLARQVTELTVDVTGHGDNHTRLWSGLVTVMGVFKVLRSLCIYADFTSLRGGLAQEFLDRVCAPRLTHLDLGWVSAPIDLARFPKLVALRLMSVADMPLFQADVELDFRSLVARSSLKTLKLVGSDFVPALLNLAELFVGGGSWPVLERLVLDDIEVVWDVKDLAGAPTAEEFVERARQLLPALADVDISKSSTKDASCRRHVVPALKGLHAGGG